MLRKKRLSEVKGLTERKKHLQSADYRDLQRFAVDFLNESDKERRKELSDEFRKRHLELYEFIKSNSDLISAETEIARTLNAVLCGDTVNSDDKQLTNFFEIIGGEFKK